MTSLAQHGLRENAGKPGEGGRERERESESEGEKRRDREKGRERRRERERKREREGERGRGAGLGAVDSGERARPTWRTSATVFSPVVELVTE